MNMKNIKNMNLTSFLSMLFISFALTTLSSCENSDQTSLSSAQACLDHANSSAAANVCVAQLGALRTPEAYLIICSAHFIAQGFSTTRFVSAYNALTSKTTGTNATAQSMAFMAFSNTTGKDGSVQTLSDCQASNVKSLVRLAVLTQMATILGTVASSLGSTYDPNVGYTPAQITAALAAFGTSPAADAATLGSTAITAGASYCAAGSSFQTSSVCTTLNTAIAGGSTPAAIGAALIVQLQVVP